MASPKAPAKKTPAPPSSAKRPAAPAASHPAPSRPAAPAVPASPQSSSTALAVPGNMAAAFADDAQENMANVHDAFHRISIKGARYKVGDTIIGDQGVTFEAIILKETPINVFYGERYNPENPTNPDCWSLGGMVPDAGVEHKQNDSCITCPQNRFGTGTNEKGERTRGKACKNARRLVLEIEGVDMPVLMSIPPMSVKHLNNYLKTLSSNVPPVPMFAAITRFGFDTTKQFPCPNMSAVRVVDAVKYAELREYRASQVVVDALNAYASPTDVVEETEPQAQAGMEAGEQTGDGSF